MVKSKLKNLRSKKFTEECALVSVFLNMTQIKDSWFLNYISPPGGSWQEYFIKVRGKIHRYYIGRDQKRVDLSLQKEKKSFLCFFIAEAKETYLKVLNERNKIHDSMLAVFKIISKSKINNKPLSSVQQLKPIYALIVGLDVENLDKDSFKAVLETERERVLKTIDKSFTKIEGGRVCILIYRYNNKTKFNLLFSNDFEKEFKNYFYRLFKS